MLHFKWAPLWKKRLFHLCHTLLACQLTHQYIKRQLQHFYVRWLFPCYFAKASRLDFGGFLFKKSS